MKKTQVFFIHGGMTFKNRKEYIDYLKNREVSLEKKRIWTDTYLREKLGRNFEIIKLTMPLKENARYTDWKIWFERYIPYIRGTAVLIGYSLGGIFLAKYLSEHTLPRKVHATYLIAPPFDNTLTEEDLVGGFRLKADLSLIHKNSKHVHLLFSQDDTVVPVIHAEKYRKKLPDADITIYKSKNGHFRMPTFPELIRMIKRDV